MLYTKLFELGSVGLNSKNIGLLFEKFNSIGFNSILTYDEISKAIRQKSLVDKVIDFLIENKIIVELDDINDDTERIFRILAEFPKSSDEKEARSYLDNKLFNSQKELLIKKLNYYENNKKDGWIVFLDLANSTDNYHGDPILLDQIMNKSFPKVVKKVEEEFFRNTSGYMIKQQGDEAFLYFFEEFIAQNFISKFITIYQNDMLEEIEKYNKSRTIIDDFQEKMYLKVFVAHSTTTKPLYEMNKMPDFNNMSAFTFIKRSEKSFKEKMVENGQKTINTHFVVSMDKFLNSNELQLSTQDGEQVVYYMID
jgi:hypothetical protein